MKHSILFLMLLSTLAQTIQCAHFEEYLQYREKKLRRSHIHLHQNYHALKEIIQTIKVLEKYDSSDPVSFAPYTFEQKSEFINTLRRYRKDCVMAGIQTPSGSDHILDVTIYILNLCHELQKPEHTHRPIFIDMYKKLENHFQIIFFQKRISIYEV